MQQKIQIKSHTYINIWSINVIWIGNAGNFLENDSIVVIWNCFLILVLFQVIFLGRMSARVCLNGRLCCQLKTKKKWHEWKILMTAQWQCKPDFLDQMSHVWLHTIFSDIVINKNWLAQKYIFFISSFSCSKLTVNSILYRTGNLRRCSHNLMKNFNSVGESGIVCDRGLFSSAKKFKWKCIQNS